MVSFKQAALQILEKSEEPLTAKEITDIALQEGLVETDGKTPEATMGAQLYVDIIKNKESPFLQVGRGKFTLKNQKDSVSSPLVIIENHNEKVKKEFKEMLHQMDPYQFEHFIGDLLKKIGYEDVVVTKSSGDGGIDVVANLTVGGITSVKTVVQVKRFRNNIPGKVITQLRGSAENDQRGLVITTSDFTKDAIKESNAPFKMPVSLVNGNKLIKLIFEHGVGIKKEEEEIYSIDNDYFQSETSTLRKMSSSDKKMSMWPLPGGNDNYIDTLNKFLKAIENGTNNKTDLINWYKNNFENVQSDRTSEGYIFVPKSMGLIEIKEGIYYLTEEGKKYIETKDLNLLYNLISKNIFAFEEIYEFLKSSNEPKKESEIYEFLKENLDVQWTTLAQTNFRILWLVNLNKIKKVEGGYLLY
jgi:HJR/Mrr/RecB family endonuclease